MSTCTEIDDAVSSLQESFKSLRRYIAKLIRKREPKRKNYAYYYANTTITARKGS